MANTEKKQLMLGKSRPAERVCRTDPYTVVNARYVGHDGFVVPRNCDEFLERFPDYVLRWVKKRLNGSSVAGDVEDWAQDLILHLRYLSKKSKHRLEGKTDVIETFDPVKQHGANEARFRNYVNLCLTNRFNTLYVQRTRDAVGRKTWVPLAGGLDCDDPGAVDDEFCHRESTYLEAIGQRLRKQHDDRLFVVQFIRFAERHDPDVLPAIDAIGQTASWADAARHLGVSKSEIDRLRNRLREVGTHFARSGQGGSRISGRRGIAGEAALLSMRLPPSVPCAAYERNATR